MAQGKVITSVQTHQFSLYQNYIQDVASDEKRPRHQEYHREGPYRYSKVTSVEADVFSSHALRISSFNTHLSSFIKYSVLQLALDGFFNTQTGKEVKCFSCGLLFHLDTDPWNPLEIHRRSRVPCRHIRGVDENNVTFGNVTPGTDAAVEFESGNSSNFERSDSQSDLDPLVRAVRTVHLGGEGGRNESSGNRQSSNQARLPVADGLTPARTTRNVQRQVLIKDYKLELCRLQSFEHWPSNAAVKPEDLANAGFYYLGTDDRVQCAFCRGILRSWEPEDRALAEHLRHFPACPFLVDPVSVGNVPLGEENESIFTTIHVREGSDIARDLVSSQIPGVHLERPTHPNYAQVAERFKTFQNYPSNAFQKPEELIRAGLFYTGDIDAVRCFFCNVLLKNWKPDDDPWVEHVKASRTCGYIRLTKGEKFIEEVLKNNRNPEKSTIRDKQRRLRKKALRGTKHKVKSDQMDSLMNTSLVRSVIEMDIATAELIRKVIISRIQQLGTEFPNTESLIEAISEYQEETGYSSEDSLSSTESSDESPSNTASGRDQTSMSLTREEQDLPNDEASLRALNEKLQEERLCKVCLDELATIVFLKCGHLVCCHNCAPAMSKCPVCRQNIVGTIRADI